MSKVNLFTLIFLSPHSLVTFSILALVQELYYLVGVAFGYS